jgi:hypothetical protein
MPISQINTNSIANGAVVAADLAAGSVTNEKIDTVAASKLTGQVPLASGGTGTTTGLALVPLQVVQLSGLSTFSFSVAAYPQYVVYLNNLGGSTASAIVRLRASNNGGSSYVSNFTFRTTVDQVSGATNVYNSDAGNTSGGYVWFDIWSGTSPSGTNGIVTIAGTSYYGVNKRLTFSAYMAGQMQGGQGVQMSMGQTQDDTTTYNNVMFELSSGTFRGSSSALICGVKAF